MSEFLRTRKMSESRRVLLTQITEARKNLHNDKKRDDINVCPAHQNLSNGIDTLLLIKEQEMINQDEIYSDIRQESIRVAVKATAKFFAIVSGLVLLGLLAVFNVFS